MGRDLERDAERCREMWREMESWGETGRDLEMGRDEERD